MTHQCKIYNAKAARYAGVFRLYQKIRMAGNNHPLYIHTDNRGDARMAKREGPIYQWFKEK